MILIILIIIIPVTTLFTGLLGIFSLSTLIGVSDMWYFRYILKKYIYFNNNIMRVKDFRPFIYFIFILSLYISVNLWSISYGTGFSILFYALLFFWSLIEISSIINVIDISHINKNEYTLQSWKKRAHKVSIYNYILFIIYFIAYAFIVSHIIFG
jgi:hypothetical protein